MTIGDDSNLQYGPEKVCTVVVEVVGLNGEEVSGHPSVRWRLETSAFRLTVAGVLAFARARYGSFGVVIGGILITGVEIGGVVTAGTVTDGVEIGGVVTPGTVAIGVVIAGVEIGATVTGGTATAGVVTLGTETLGTLTWGVVRLSMCVVGVGGGTTLGLVVVGVTGEVPVGAVVRAGGEVVDGLLFTGVAAGVAATPGVTDGGALGVERGACSGCAARPGRCAAPE